MYRYCKGNERMKKPMQWRAHAEVNENGQKRTKGDEIPVAAMRIPSSFSPPPRLNVAECDILELHEQFKSCNYKLDGGFLFFYFKVVVDVTSTRGIPVDSLRLMQTGLVMLS
jgi:hypothetical protein